jgi:hypothetical protein
MRTALETIKKNYKGTKLEDGLPIGGRNRRLTDDKIHQLTVYYGSAIRSHVQVCPKHSVNTRNDNKCRARILNCWMDIEPKANKFKAGGSGQNSVREIN